MESRKRGPSPLFIALLAVIFLIGVFFVFISMSTSYFWSYLTYEWSHNCEEKPTQKARDTCFNNRALMEKNETFCEMIIDNGERWTCYGRLANQMWNLDICHKAEGGVEHCQIVFAQMRNNISVCDEVVESLHGQWHCYNAVDRTMLPEICENAGDKKEECYNILITYATDYEKEEVCNLIRDAHIMEHCKERFLNKSI